MVVDVGRGADPMRPPRAPPRLPPVSTKLLPDGSHGSLTGPWARERAPAAARRRRHPGDTGHRCSAMTRRRASRCCAEILGLHPAHSWVQGEIAAGSSSSFRSCFSHLVTPLGQPSPPDIGFDECIAIAPAGSPEIEDSRDVREPLVASRPPFLDRRHHPPGGMSRDTSGNARARSSGCTGITVLAVAMSKFSRSSAIPTTRGGASSGLELICSKDPLAAPPEASRRRSLCCLPDAKI
jgi:hypothetical protein